MPRSQLPWTHFHVNPATGRITGFVLDKCDACGGPIQAANPIELKETPERLLSLGLVQVQDLPVEGYYSDDIGGEACYNCNA